MFGSIQPRLAERFPYREAANYLVFREVVCIVDYRA